jgi:hypothetical protein
MKAIAARSRKHEATWRHPMAKLFVMSQASPVAASRDYGRIAGI